MKKINQILIVFFMSFFISGCMDEKTASKEASNVVKGLELIEKQLKYPTQNEFSVGLIWKSINVKYGDMKEEESVFKTIIGDLSKNFKQNNEYILFQFNKDPEKNRSSGDRMVCFKILEKLNDEDKLYGYNIGSSIIVKREGVLDDDDLMKLACDNYFKGDYDSLFIALKNNR